MIARWLEVSVRCPECGSDVSVYSSTVQDDEGDGVILAAGDLYRCEDGHVGSIGVASGQAHLGEPTVTLATLAEVEELTPVVDGRPQFRGLLVAPEGE